MTERFRERLGYLSDEFEERSVSGHLRSVSPHLTGNGARTPRNQSKSPRPHASVDSSPQGNAIRDSRPDIIAWPTPPNAHGNNNNNVNNNNGNTNQEQTNEDPPKLLSMLKIASSNAPRGRESELKKKIKTLEDTVAEYERQKYNVMGTFSEYRERVAERERKLEAEYSNKIIALSEEVLGAKKDFEARMKSFQALQDKFEREKEQALEKLRQEHQKEIQLLEQRFSESQLLNLEQKYMIEIQRLEEERKSLKAEKERLGETFEMKLRRAQSLYETELTAAKMLYSKELEALRDHEEALKEELLARQDEFHDRLQELQHQTKRSREELATCKNEVTALEKRLQVKEAEVVAISKELEEARNETNDSLKKLSQVENELFETKQQYRQQEEELQRKSNLLNIVETAKSKLEAVIRDLQTEVKALKNKVEFLEKERVNLQSQSESQTKLQNSQVNALEAVLETVTKEKESTKAHYEDILERERQQAEEREFAMKKEFSSKLNELEAQYNNLKDHVERDSQRNNEGNSSKGERQAIVPEDVEDLKHKLDLLSSGNKTVDDETILRFRKLVDESGILRKEVEKYKKLLDKKENEIRRVEHTQKLVDEQNRAIIKDEIRTQLIEFPKNQEVKDTEEKILLRGDEHDDHNQTKKDKMMDDIEVLQTKLSFPDEMENEDVEEDTIKKLNEQMVSSTKRNEESKLMEKHMREEFQSRVDERVEEETLKVCSMYEDKILQMQKEADEKSEKCQEEMNVLKSECEDKSKEIKELNEKNQKLVNELEMMRDELKRKDTEIEILNQKMNEYAREYMATEGVQTNETKPIGSDNKIDDLKTKIEQLQRDLKEKDALVEQLHEVILTSQNSESDTKQNRSHSFTAGEASRKQKMVGDLQILLTKSRAKYTQGDKQESRGSSSSVNERKNSNESDSSKTRRKKEKDTDRDRSNHSTTGIPRPKSPHSNRLRERSPTKSKSPTFDNKQKDERRHYLNPETERLSSFEERRRSSPGNQLPQRTKKESCSSLSGQATSLSNKEEQKRPAWKF